MCLKIADNFKKCVASLDDLIIRGGQVAKFAIRDMLSLFAAPLSQSSTATWEFNSFGTIITHACGLASCQAEANYLEESIQSAKCSGAYKHKVSLVLDGGDIDDGTFNQLAYEGALAACTDAADCCREVERGS